MNKFLSSAAALSVLLLMGAGCSQSPTETPPPIDQPQVQLPATEPTPTEPAQGSDLVLTGEALGNNMVKFSWQIPQGMEEPASFRLVRGPSEDPALPRSYYFQVLGSKREITWTGLLPGKQFFRICTYVNNECKEYSNNVEVEVK